MCMSVFHYVYIYMYMHMYHHHPYHNHHHHQNLVFVLLVSGGFRLAKKHFEDQKRIRREKLCLLVHLKVFLGHWGAERGEWRCPIKHRVSWPWAADDP